MTGFIILIELRCSQDICIALTTRDEKRCDAVKEKKRKLKILSYFIYLTNELDISPSLRMYLTLP